VKIRVLVANQPRLIRELVLETIADQPDIEIVGTVQEHSDLADVVEKTRPDYLIIALEQTHQAYCGFLLGRYPQMRILAVAAQGGDSLCYWVHQDIRTRVVETSQAGLINVLSEAPESLAFFTPSAKLN
jgi:chemotaxis response regulator CheB